MAEEAKAAGLAVVVWSYPRGPKLDKVAETALDICAYAAHMAALLGAHIIKVKPPTSAISLERRRRPTRSTRSPVNDPGGRFEHVVQACFGGRRLVVFSGGEAKGDGGHAGRGRRRSMPAAATARSWAATPSSGRRPRRWSC